MTPRSPEAVLLAVLPLGLMAGLGWSLAWTTGETAVFLLGVTLLLTPIVWVALLVGMRRRYWPFALWGALAWAAIVPGTWEAEEHFTDLRFESQRDTLEAEAASIERLVDGRRGAITVQTTPEISPFEEAWVHAEGEASEVWFLRRRDRAFVYAPAGFSPHVSSACRALDGPWYDCGF